MVYLSEKPQKHLKYHGQHCNSEGATNLRKLVLDQILLWKELENQNPDDINGDGLELAQHIDDSVLNQDNNQQMAYSSGNTDTLTLQVFSTSQKQCHVLTDELKLGNAFEAK
ncbi:hypothetical protein ILUMI_24644 [Ignelater luminosus]|uniref:Uncharacterized protein n=1 Tax=Ignelater luminosus TaxID=2038154 RepID=A0A8K0C9U3_IGNLU|nr:hypothetical protein ILUMI_24644 [Ignelater luminosus]